MTTRIKQLCAVAAVVLLVLGACNLEEFEPKSEINYLRIMAITADTPTLAPGTSTDISAVIASPDTSDLVSYSWQICAFPSGAQQRYQCPEDALLAEGQGPRIEFEYLTFFQPIVEDICEQLDARADPDAEPPEPDPDSPFPTLPDIEGLEGILPDCERGLPVTVRLQAVNETTGREEIGVRTLYLLRDDSVAQAEINANPEVVELTLEAGPDAMVTLPLQPDEEIDLRCDVDPMSLQTFTPPDEDEARRESLLFSWFIRGGELTSELKVLESDDPLSELDAQEENSFTPFDDVDEVTLWCFVRDGRGGLDWATVSYEVARQVFDE